MYSGKTEIHNIQSKEENYMKSFGKRIISLSLVLILIFSVTAILSSCYIVDSGTLSQIEGLYELSMYSGKTNYLEEREMKLMIIIKSDGSGYFAYKDKDTAPFISELKCTYEEDDENPGKYDFLYLQFRGSFDTPYHMAINVKNKNLNARQAHWKGNIFSGNLAVDYYTDVRFDKISKKTELSQLEKEFGEDGAPFIPFGGTTSQGAWVIDRYDTESADSPFVYFYVDIDLYGGSGRAWYMLKSDEEAKTETFTVSYEQASDGNFIVLGDVRFPIEKTESNLILPIGDKLFDLYYLGRATDEEIEEAITADLNKYTESKTDEDPDGGEDAGDAGNTGDTGDTGDTGNTGTGDTGTGDIGTGDIGTGDTGTGDGGTGDASAETEETVG